MIVILQLPSFFDTSSVERAKCVRRVAVYFLVIKSLNLMGDCGRKTGDCCRDTDEKVISEKPPDPMGVFRRKINAL